MATTQIRFEADTSNFNRGVKEAADSIGEITNKIKEAQNAGDFATAAQLSKQADSIRNNTSNNGSNIVIGSIGNANAVNKLDIRLELLTKVIESLTDELGEATESGRHKDAFNLSAALNNVEQERIRLEAEKKRIETPINDGAMEAIKRYGLSRYLSQGLRDTQQAFSIGYNYRQAVANGDYLGAKAGVIEGVSSFSQGMGSTLLGAGIASGLWPLAVAGGVLQIGGTVGSLIAGDKKADIAEQSAYERSLQHSNALNKRFSNSGDWKTNSINSLKMLNLATSLAEDTGLSTYDLTNLATQMTQYGVNNESFALGQARNIALRANATGVDNDVLSSLYGMAFRYGDTTDVLSYSSKARNASGLTKGQDSEFLNALQRIIEDGISQGYVKSVKDVSDTMVMFARLSDNNPMWQGQQGANRLNQMNSSIAGATNLQSVNDVIVASSARSLLNGKSIAERSALLGTKASGTYIDDMLLMEKGTNPAMFGAIAKNILNLEGNNYAGAIERVKDTFNVNYKGAVDIYAMMNKIGKNGFTETDFAKSVQSMQSDQNYISDATKRQNALNNLDDNVRKIAQSKYWEATDGLTGGNNSKKGIIGNTTATTNSVASSSESAKKANEIINNKYSNSTIVEDSVDTADKLKVQSAIINNALNKSGDYLGAVNAILNPNEMSYAMTSNELINSKYGSSNYAIRFSNKEIGNDEKDEVFKKMLADAATTGGIRNGFGKRKAADGIVDRQEIIAAINEVERNNSVKRAYENGSMTEYINALESMFRKLFGEGITLNTQSYN